MDLSFEPEIYFLAPQQPPWVQTQGTQSSSRLKTTTSLVRVHFNGLKLGFQKFISWLPSNRLGFKPKEPKAQVV